jgi:putative transposase
MKRSKQTYDTSFMAAYVMGIRGKQYDMVPSSTKWHWENNTYFDNIIGYKHMEKYVHVSVVAEQYKCAKTLLFGLIRLFYMYQNIVNALPNKNDIIWNYRSKIIQITSPYIARFSVAKISHLLGISYQHYNMLCNNFFCKFSPVLLCRKAFPKQLSLEEISLISSFLKNPEFENWSLISIYYKLIRESQRFFSEKTFYKYVRILELRKKKIKVQKRSIGPRASKPLQLLHMDITEYWVTDSVRLYTHVIMDNFSRKLMGCKIGITKSDSLALDNLKDVYTRFRLHLHSESIIIMSDGGGENFGKTKHFIASKKNLKQHIALRNKKDCCNNMVEALIRKIKECFLYDNSFSSADDFEKHILSAINSYNSTMPLAATGGRTPDEAFNGINPFPEKLDIRIQNSRTLRFRENVKGH